MDELPRSTVQGTRHDISSLADYQTTQLATIIAGNDLPDILFIAPGVAINGLTQFLQAKCADLTQYLSGDAVKDYPNLANFTTLSWQSVIFNKAIYGVPSPYPVVPVGALGPPGAYSIRTVLQPPTNLDDYTTLLKHFTNPQQDLYGLATENNIGYGITNGFFTAMYGLPNNWGLDNGKLTYSLEIRYQGRHQHSARAVGNRGVLAEFAAVQHRQHAD